MPIEEKLRVYTPDEWNLDEWKGLLNVILDLLYCDNLDDAISLTGLTPIEMSTAIEMFAIANLYFSPDSTFMNDREILDRKRYEVIDSIRGFEFYARMIKKQISKRAPDDESIH